MKEITEDMKKSAKKLYAGLMTKDNIPNPNLLNDEVAWKTLLMLADEDTKVEIIKNGKEFIKKGLHLLVKDESIKVRLALVDIIDIIYKVHFDYATALCNDPDERVRLAIVDKGYSIYSFYVDRSPRVRAAVAMNKCCLKELSTDSNELVRAAVVKAGYNVESFIDDPSPIVRAAVASMGVGLDVLYKDRDPSVRVTVAKQGYIEKLINDPDSMVRTAVVEYCIQNY